MSGLWETLPSGQTPSVNCRMKPTRVSGKYLIDAAQRDESMRQRLFEIRARLEEHESGS